MAASTTTPQAYTFLTTLLKNPNISVNIQDHESGQTALHRALYVGNIRAARDLLLRNDIDLSIKDIEGLTAFDLYNGTVEGVRTSPYTRRRGVHADRSRRIHRMMSTALIFTYGVSIVSCIPLLYPRKWTPLTRRRELRSRDRR